MDEMRDKDRPMREDREKRDDERKIDERKSEGRDFEKREGTKVTFTPLLLKL